MLPDTITARATLWHVDSSFNSRRASFSLLRACVLPPPGNGGNTDFADSRTAFDELPPKLKKDLLGNDYIAAHCMAASRKKGSPDFFKDLHLSKEPISRHRIVQKHEPSGRTLYVAAHVHRIEGVLDEKSTELLETLIRHATQKNYTTSVAWESPRDMVIWDNRCVMHRAGGGAFEGEYVRDLRRTTVHDDNPMAWGLNETSAKWRGFSVDQK